MRNMLVAALVFGMAIAFTVTASASDSVLKQDQSFLDLKIGSIPQIHLTAQSGAVNITASGGGHIITEAASVFQTDTFTVQSAVFTGLPQLSGLKISLHAGIGSFSDGSTTPNPVGTGVVSGFGGSEANTGFFTLYGGGFSFNISLANLGSGGMAVLSPVLNNVITITGAKFNTGAVNITGLSSNVISVPGLGGLTGVAFTLNLTTVQLLSATELTTGLGDVLENATVTLSHGYNILASGHSTGAVKMVAPFRLKTGSLAGNVAGSITKTLTFVPEPGTVLLLVTGAAGLAIVGRKRMRK